MDDTTAIVLSELNGILDLKIAIQGFCWDHNYFVFLALEGNILSTMVNIAAGQNFWFSICVWYILLGCIPSLNSPFSSTQSQLFNTHNVEYNPIQHSCSCVIVLCWNPWYTCLKTWRVSHGNMTDCSSGLTTSTHPFFPSQLSCRSAGAYLSCLQGEGWVPPWTSC